MRIALFLFAILIASFSAHGATAYEALRVLGKQRNEALLDKIVEVSGESGKPQPAVWKIIVKDLEAKGGLNEYSVQGTRLTGEQAPASRPTGEPMNMSQLNLDSDGVHQIAEREAKKVTFAYDHADYSLRAGSRGGSPVWEIRLVDGRTGDVAMMTVAATTGNVLSTEGFTNRRNVAKAAPVTKSPPVAASPLPPQPKRLTEQPDEIAESPDGPSGKGGAQDVADGLERFAEKVGNNMERRGRKVGDFFHNLFNKDKRDSTDSSGSVQNRTTPPAPPATRDPAAVPPSRVRD